MFRKRYDQRQQDLLEAAEKRRRAIARQKSAELSKLYDREQREFTRQMEEARRIEQREEMKQHRLNRPTSSPTIKKQSKKRISTSSQKQRSSSSNRKAKSVIKSKNVKRSSDRSKLVTETQLNRIRHLLETIEELIPPIRYTFAAEPRTLPETDKISYFDILDLKQEFEHQMNVVSRHLKEEITLSKDIQAKMSKMQTNMVPLTLIKALLQGKLETSVESSEEYKHKLATTKKILSKLQAVINSPAGKTWKHYPAASLSTLSRLKKSEPNSGYIDRPRIRSANASLWDRYGPPRYSDYDGESLDDLANDWGWDSWDQFSDTIE